MNKQKFSLNEYGDTIKEVLDSGGEFRIYPAGTSMLPLIREETDSVVLAKPSGYLKAGDIAFYRRNNGAYILHRVIKAENGSYIMCGDNQLTKEKGINHSQVIGIVTKIYRNDKPLDRESLHHKAYLLIWKSFFVRRVYLKLKYTFKGGNK